MLIRAWLAAAAVVSVLLATPTPALAGSNDTKSGTVTGVPGVDPNNAGCLPGCFCLYTGGNGTGIEFKPYNCQVYSLNSGSYTNENTGGSPAQFLDENFNIIHTSYPFEFVAQHDFRAVWFVRACLWYPADGRVAVFRRHPPGLGLSIRKPGELMSTIRTFIRGIAAVGTALVAMTTATGAPAHADSGSWHGCPRGAACLFTGTDRNNPGGIIYEWWDGVYTLYEVYGNHLVYNNQTDGWVIDLCYGWNGRDCPNRVTPIQGVFVRNFTPINSVNLHPDSRN